MNFPNKKPGPEARGPFRRTWLAVAVLLLLTGMTLVFGFAARGRRHPPPRPATGRGCAPGTVGDACR